MKKIFICLILSISLVGCSNKVVIEPKELSVLTPSGSAALSLLGVMDNELLDIEVVDGGEVLQASFSTGDKDLIVAPINVGYKLSSITDKYKMLGILTWGNLFYYSKVENPKQIAVFGEASIPGIMTKLVKDYLPNDAELVWFNSTQEVAQAFLSNKYDACVVAEPVATQIRNKISDLIEIDIQECYSLLNNFDDPFPMAALFVNNDLLKNDKQYVESIFDIIMMTANSYSLTKAIVKDRLEEFDIKEFGFNDKDLIIDSYVNMKIEPEYARNYIDNITKTMNYCGLELNEDYIIK